MVHVPYRSTSALAIDMAGGHMLLGVLDTTNTMAQAKAGRLRPLAVTGPSRSKGLPEVPTMIEQGVNFSAGIWTGIFGPANMPKPIVDKLNLEIGKILREPETREKFSKALGLSELPLKTPEQFAQSVKDDVREYGVVIKAGNIKIE